jgi:hypothetical protein
MKTLADHAKEFERLLQESPTIGEVLDHLCQHLAPYPGFFRNSKPPSKEDQQMVKTLIKTSLERLTQRTGFVITSRIFLENQETGIIHGLLEIPEEGSVMQVACSKRVALGVVGIQDAPLPLNPQEEHYLRFAWAVMPPCAGKG